MTCERCGAEALDKHGQPDLTDYCAECGTNLCKGCMEEGCCGAVPAASGMQADHAGDDDPENDDPE